MGFDAPDEVRPARSDALLGRVARTSRGRCWCWSPRGPLTAVVPGRLRRDDNRPAVGDFVTLARRAGTWVIAEVLARRSVFTRKKAGRRSAAQVVAANVDTAMLVTGLDGDFNERRLERYLALARGGGAEPVVVLNKADLCERVDDRIAAAATISAGAEVLAVSAREGGGVSSLSQHLVPGRTLAMLGSSGSGKSTLVNRLAGCEVMKTAEVRARDARGRHTTTTRELIAMPNGALLIDTPGMRELGLVGDGDSIEDTFDDVAALAERCRFSDCEHESEPGCAVREALHTGTLSAERLAGYTKLRRELRRHERRRSEPRRKGRG